MKALIIALTTLLALTQDASAVEHFLMNEPIQCRYQLRNDGYSQPMEFRLEFKVVTENGQRYIETSLSTVSRYFSALNMSVRSTTGYQTQPGGMLRMQSSDPAVNSKAEILNRTIKLEVRDLDGRDWRSISCLRNGLQFLVDTSMQALRAGPTQ